VAARRLGFVPVGEVFSGRGVGIDMPREQPYPSMDSPCKKQTRGSVRPEPTQYFSTLLLLYPTTPEGKLDVEGTRAGKWRLVPWRFGRSMYHEIFSLNDGLRANGLSIAEQDVRLECQDAKYQRIKVSFVGKAVWRSNDSFKQKVLSVAVPQYDRLVPFRAMSTDDLRSKLGLGGTPGLGATPMNPVSDTDFSGLLDTV
jgi:hypothetical protein